MTKSERDKKIISLVNKTTSLLDKEGLTVKELSIFLSYLMVYCGESMTPVDIDVEDLNVEDLYSTYYNKRSDDIGLGFVLNGLEILSILDEGYNNDVTV
jgi:hypothetical protein